MPDRGTMQVLRRHFGDEDEESQRRFDQETLHERVFSPFRPESPPDPEEEEKSKLERLWDAFVHQELEPDATGIEKSLTGPRGFEDALGGRPMDTPHSTPSAGPDAPDSPFDLIPSFDDPDDDAEGPSALTRLGQKMHGASQRLLEAVAKKERALTEHYQSQQGGGVGMFGGMPPESRMTEVEEQGDLLPVSDALRMGRAFTGGVVDEMENVGTGIPRLVEHELPEVPGPLDDAIRATQGGIANVVEGALTPMQEATEGAPVEGTSDVHEGVAHGAGRAGGILASFLAGGGAIGQGARASQLSQAPGRLGKFMRAVGQTESSSVPRALMKDAGRFLPFDIASEAGDQEGGTLGFAAEMAHDFDVDTPLPGLFGVEDHEELAELARESPGARAIGGAATGFGVGAPMALVEGAIGAGRLAKGFREADPRDVVRVAETAAQQGQLAEMPLSAIRAARRQAREAGAGHMDKILALEEARRRTTMTGQALEPFRRGKEALGSAFGSAARGALRVSDELGRSVGESVGNLVDLIPPDPRFVGSGGDEAVGGAARTTTENLTDTQNVRRAQVVYDDLAGDLPNAARPEPGAGPNEGFHSVSVGKPVSDMTDDELLQLRDHLQQKRSAQVRQDPDEMSGATQATQAGTAADLLHVERTMMARQGLEGGVDAGAARAVGREVAGRGAASLAAAGIAHEAEADAGVTFAAAAAAAGGSPKLARTVEKLGDYGFTRNTKFPISDKARRSKGAMTEKQAARALRIQEAAVDNGWTPPQVPYFPTEGPDATWFKVPDDDLIEHALRGRNGRDWYEEQRDLLSAFPEDEQELIAMLAGATSISTNPQQNFLEAIEAYSMLKQNRAVRGIMKGKKEKLFSALRESGDVDLGEFSPKIWSYAKNLLGDEFPATIDRWMVYALTGEKGGVDGHAYGEAAQKIRQLAKRLSEETGENWTPAQTQAAIWFSVRAHAEDVWKMSQGVIPQRHIDGFPDAVEDAGLAIPLKREKITEMPIGGRPGRRRVPDEAMDFDQVRPERKTQVQKDRLSELNRPVHDLLSRLGIRLEDIPDFGSSRGSPALRADRKKGAPLQTGAYQGQSEVNTAIRLPERTEDGELVEPWMRKMVAAVASGSQGQNAAVYRTPRFPNDVDGVDRIFDKSGDEYMEVARDLDVDGAFFGEEVVATQFLTLEDTDDLARHLDEWYRADPENRVRLDFQHDKDHLWFGMYDDNYLRYTDDGPVPTISPEEFDRQLRAALKEWDHAGVFEPDNMKLAFADGEYLEPDDGRGWKGVFDDAYEEGVAARGEGGIPFRPGLYDDLVGRSRTRVAGRTVPEDLRAVAGVDQSDLFANPEAGAASPEAVRALAKTGGYGALGAAGGALADNEKPGRGAAIGGLLGAAAGGAAGVKAARSAQTVAEDATPVLRAISKGDEPRTWEGTWREVREGASELRRGVVDDVLPIRHLEKQLREEGLEGAAQATAELERLVRLARGDQEYGLLSYEKGVHRFHELAGEGARKFRTRGLETLFTDIGRRMNEFRQYGLARRVQELRNTDRPVPKKLDTPEARQAQRQILEEADEDLERWFEEVQEFQSEWMRVLEEEGVIRSADDILEQNQHYFPLFRDFDDLQASGAKGVEPTVGGGGVVQRPNLIKRIRGEKTAHRIIDPVESLIRLNYMFSNAVHRQRATDQLARVAKDLPEGNGLIEKAGPGEVARAIRVGKEQLKGSIPDEVIEAMPEDFLTVFTPRKPDKANKLVRVLDEEGEATYYRLSEGMWDALMGTSTAHLSPTLQLMLAPVNFAATTLRTLVTTVDPSFAFRNFFRDTNHVAITSRYKASGIRGVAQAWGDAMGGLGVLLADAMPNAVSRTATGTAVGAGLGALADTETGRGAAVGAALGAGGANGLARIGKKFAARAGLTPEEVVDVFRSSGAMQAAYLSMDRKAIQKSLKSAIRAGEGKNPIPYSNPFEALRGFGMAFENANRVGEMVRILESEGVDPKSIQLAAEQTRDISIDFARHGSWTAISALRQMSAFWNARIQGYDKIARAFRDPKTRRRAAQVAIGGITAPSLALYSINRNNPDYWETNTWERNLFWMVPLPDAMGGGFLRIPKPFELGLVFGSSFERMAEALDPANPEVEEDQGVGGALANVQNAIGEEFGKSFSEMVTPTPNILQPFMENRANENWNGIPVVPAYEDISRLPDELKGSENASKLGNTIGQWLDVPPPQVDNVLTAWTGRIGWQLLEQSDKWADQMDPDKGPSPAEHFKDGFLVRTFFSQKTKRTPRSVSRFYETLNLAESSWNAVKKYERQGNREKALDTLNENFDVMQGLADLREAAEEIRDLRDLAENIEDGKEFTQLSAEQKRQEIDRIYRQVQDLAQDVLERTQ